MELETGYLECTDEFNVSDAFFSAVMHLLHYNLLNPY
jgi:hypothetical protein